MTKFFMTLATMAAFAFGATTSAVACEYSDKANQSKAEQSDDQS